MTNIETYETVATVALPSATAAPTKTAAMKAARRKRPSKGEKVAPRAKSKKPARTGQKSVRQSAPRRQSKSAKILQMIGRAQGATLAEIQKATEWQAHSVRGFLSTAGKRHGVQIEVGEE